MSREPADAEIPQPPERFRKRLEAVAPVLRGQTAERLAGFLAELDAWRRRINLTGRLSPDDLVAHALESVPATSQIPENARVVDIGSGAGLPAIPLAIFCPTASFTLIEPTAKQAAFLRHAARVLALSNLSVRAVRIQDVRGESFDVATTRGVGSLGAVLGSLAFLEPGGRLLVWTTEPEPLARELSALRLSKAIPIEGTRSKVVAVFEKPR